MFVSAKGKHRKKIPLLQRQEQRIDHIPYYLLGLSRAHFFRNPVLKQLYKGRRELGPTPEGNKKRLIWERERPSLTPTLAVFCLIFRDLCK